MEREEISVEKIKQIISKYEKEQIIISEHYLDYLNKGKRELSPEFIKEILEKL